MNERLGNTLKYIQLHPEIEQERRKEERAKRNSLKRHLLPRQRETGYLFTRLKWYLFKAQSDGPTQFGCTIYELRQHLQEQFTKGMAWDNHGEVWEIDHVCQRRGYKVEHLINCFHYTNLRPRLTCLNRIEGRRRAAA